MTYEVQYSTNGTFYRVNVNDTMFHSYQHTITQKGQGKYILLIYSGIPSQQITMTLLKLHAPEQIRLLRM